MSNISNGMVVVKVYHIQPEEVEALFVHRLHVGVMIRAPELKVGYQYSALFQYLYPTCCSQHTELTGFSSAYWFGL